MPSASGAAGDLPRGDGESEPGGAANPGGDGVGGTPSAGANAGGNGGQGGNGQGSGAGGGGGKNTSSGGAAAGGQGGASGAGGSASTLPEAAGPGTVTAPWADFCVATLTADFAVVDSGNRPLFTARAGEKYLIEFEFSAHWARLLYLTPGGPFEFDVKNDTEQVPFDSNCQPTGSLSTYANFVDVSIYAENTLVTKLCDLKAGTFAPYDHSKSSGATVDLSPNASTEVEALFLNSFSARCNGAEVGYARRRWVTVSRISYGLVPFVAIAG